MRIAADIDLSIVPADDIAAIKGLVEACARVLAHSLQPLEGKHATIKLMIDAQED